MTEKEFNSKVMELIQRSLATSKIAVEKAQQEDVKEFAGFEVAETTALTIVLKDINTILPEMDETAKATFTEIESAAGSSDFDKLYIKDQVETHKVLRDLTEEYLLEAPTDKLDKEESRSKHIAMMALTVFNEHLTLSQKIAGAIQV